MQHASAHPRSIWSRSTRVRFRKDHVFCSASTSWGGVDTHSGRDISRLEQPLCPKRSGPCPRLQRHRSGWEIRSRKHAVKRGGRRQHLQDRAAVQRGRLPATSRSCTASSPPPRTSKRTLPLQKKRRSWRTPAARRAQQYSPRLIAAMLQAHSQSSARRRSLRLSLLESPSQVRKREGRRRSRRLSGIIDKETLPEAPLLRPNIVRLPHPINGNTYKKEQVVKLVADFDY